MKCELPKKDKTLIKASLLSAMCWLAAASGAVAQAADAPRLMRNPSLSISQVAFFSPTRSGQLLAQEALLAQ